MIFYNLSRQFFGQASCDGTDHTTPVHQDFVHFQGCFETYTFWAPVGDCPIELGPLALIPGSHKVGRVMRPHFSLGAGALAIPEKEQTGEWACSDFEVGDSLIFPSLTVHQALPNVTEDRMRVSLDNRYQAFGRPIAEFQGLQWMLADMSIQLEAARGLLYRAASSAQDGTGAGFPDALLAAQAKVYASEMAIKVTNDALQVFGAKGYSRDTGIERIVRDARMFTIGGGTAQILRTVIASRILHRKLPQTRDGYQTLHDS